MTYVILGVMVTMIFSSAVTLLAYFIDNYEDASYLILSVSMTTLVMYGLGRLFMPLVLEMIK